MELEPIVDSSYGSLAEAIRGTRAPQHILDSLVLIDVEYLSFDGLLHKGQIVIHTDLASDVEAAFAALLAMRFPIQKAVPIVAYGWDDELSMADNNSSGFNYRVILGTDEVSNHALGRALDINPALNPYIARDGKTYPKQAFYDPSVPGTLVGDGDVVRFFEERGWKWNAPRIGRADFQHFEKGT